MEMPALPLGSRRNEDIALDLMKFIAMTTSYGKTTGAGVGFQGTGAAAKPEDYAAVACSRSKGNKPEFLSRVSAGNTMSRLYRAMRSRLHQPFSLL